ncbi:hypothetical protein GPALN_014161 [Globodera pallida]|nr:hypothetical protein GPALN_014161 [Globodera pallida]
MKSSQLRTEVIRLLEEKRDLMRETKELLVEKKQLLSDKHQLLEDKQRLLTENSQMEENNSDNDNNCCAICLVRQRKFVCVPCGHYAICKTCAEQVAINGECPFCRQNIDGLIKIFRP